MSIEENTQEIADPITRHLIKTLSRTNRKDYENYVINAIWHRLNNSEIEVVSQQYVEDPGTKTGRSHYFIDLYFPTLNIGIECDEAYHKKQLTRDMERQVTIYDVLYGIRLSAAYTSIRIDVTQSFDVLQKQIDDSVEMIRQRAREACPPKWKIESAEQYYATKKTISTSDKKGFGSIVEACNVLFKLGRKASRGTSRACFTPAAFRGPNHPFKDYELWFPKLALRIKNVDGTTQTIAATNSGWHNLLEENGSRITERNEKVDNSKPDDKPRITFVKYRDPLGNNEYKFVGVFRQLKEKIDGATRYERVASEIDLGHFRTFQNCPEVGCKKDAA